MDARKRILFVDDEAKVLDGLRRLLRPMRNEWDMTFVSSGAEALEEMAKQPFDVIVSDMRMPGMGGAELLEKVRKEYPKTVRIVLSGHADKDDILKSFGPIHQYLSKPCDAETLKSTLARTLKFTAMLRNTELAEMVSRIESLPSISSLYNELISKLRMPDISPRAIGETISRDIGMTSKILHLVNSAFFGVRRHISSPIDAVSLLGLETVRALVMSLQVFSQIGESDVRGFSYSALLQHSVAVGTFAKRVAGWGELEPKLVDHAFIAGLLHDVGKLVLASRMSEKYEQALSVVATRRIPPLQAERELVGATHADVGAYLLGLWGFANEVVEAVAYHHEPADSPIREFSVLTAVHVANALASADGSISQKGGYGAIDMDYLAALGLTERLEQWQQAWQKHNPQEVQA